MVYGKLTMNQENKRVKGGKGMDDLWRRGIPEILRPTWRGGKFTMFARLLVVN